MLGTVLGFVRWLLDLCTSRSKKVRVDGTRSRELICLLTCRKTRPLSSSAHLYTDNCYANRHILKFADDSIIVSSKLGSLYTWTVSLCSKTDDLFRISLHIPPRIMFTTSASECDSCGNVCPKGLSQR